MQHTMHLAPEPYALLASGEKTVELRLYDEKRRQLRVGDEIQFLCTEDGHPPLHVRVKAIYLFRDFGELYETLPLLNCGYTRQTLPSASPRDMEVYYTPEQQARYGVMGIVCKLLGPSNTAVGRYLCRILRHHPEMAGITLDAQGWADIPALLDGIREVHPLTRAQLEEIVRKDPKQRYALCPNKTKIRANQGHSFPVDLGLTEQAPPEILYHGTGKKQEKAIRNMGLSPQTRQYVHLSPDRETAKSVGLRHGLPVVLPVLSGQMHRDGFRFYRAKNGVWLTEKVPPRYLLKE